MRFTLPSIQLPNQLENKLKLNQGARTVLTVALVAGAMVGLSISAYAVLTGGPPGECPNEEPIIVPDVEKKLIQMGPSRSGNCIVPQTIIMHNTAVGTLESNWDYFNSGGGTDNVNAHFITGTDGRIYQTVEFYKEMVEFAITSNHLNNYAISIEMVGPYTHENKESQPEAQYNATLNLVCNLMQMYNIPIGPNPADWVNEGRNGDPDLVPGIYGHHQLGVGKEDPGVGWFADFLADLEAGNCGAAGPRSGSGAGRMVPYDAYARPYSWPLTGTVRQDYGYTEEAQILGARFPSLYPKGNPGTIFSIDNHDEQPIDPATAKYINPNIDIAPESRSNQARAVYATHAGWLTFADWAGPEKGYTIQIESDIEGDGQADLATRYMRLQPPKDGFFAPDVPVTRLIMSNQQSSVGAVGECTNGPEDGSGTREGDWANVNRWNEEILIGIAEAKETEGVDVPCNLVKAFMQVESGGVEIPPNVSGYHGLMQVADNSVPGGGSDCDWHVYDLYTTQGNINCGVQEIARGYKVCGAWDAAMSRYLSGNCDKYRDVSDAYGTTPLIYSNIVMDLWQLLDNYNGGTTTTVPTLPAPNPTTENPEAAETISPPPYVLEGEHMNPASEDGGAEVVYDDASASAGASMKLTTSVNLNKEMRQKADQIMIRAKSIKNLACLNGEDPELEVYITSEPAGSITVNSTVFQTYPVAVEGLDGSDHILTLRLANPGALLCDRAVWIDAIYYVITNPNTPTVETVSKINVEAEDIPDATEGEEPTTIEESNSASEGRYRAFTAKSKIEGEFELPEANYFTIRARADLCRIGNEVPILKISVDDQEILSLGVGDERWTEYSYKFLPGQSILNPSSTPSNPPSTTTPPPSSGSNGDGSNDGGTPGSPSVGDGTGGAPFDPSTPGSPSVGDGTGGAPFDPSTPGSPSVGDGTGGAPIPSPSTSGSSGNVRGETTEGGKVLQQIDPGGPGGGPAPTPNQNPNIGPNPGGDIEDPYVPPPGVGPNPGGDIEESDGDDEDNGDGSSTIDPDEDSTEEDEPNTYKLTIEFVNGDTEIEGCDLNVYVDVLRFEQFTVTQAVYSKVSIIGKTKYIAYNQLIGYVSSSRGSDEEFEAYKAEVAGKEEENPYPVAGQNPSSTPSNPPSTSTPPPSSGSNGDGLNDGGTPGSPSVGDGTGGAPFDPSTPGSPSVGDGTGGAPFDPSTPGSPSVGDGTGGAPIPSPSTSGSSGNVRGETTEGGKVLQQIDPGGPGGSDVVIEPEDEEGDSEDDGEMTEEEEAELKKKFYSLVPNPNQVYLSYRIMYNNPNFTTFPLPIERDLFINAEVDNPYIVETPDNTVAGSLKTIFDVPDAPMFFFCALRQKGDSVRCIQEPNP